MQLSGSTINFLAETKISLFAAAIETTRKNHLCIFGKFEDIFGFKERFSQKVLHLLQCAAVCANYQFSISRFKQQQWARVEHITDDNS